MIVDDEENAEMSDEDQENINVNSQTSKELKEQAEKSVWVTDKKTEERVELKTGQEAFYALLAQDLLKLAQEYERDVAEVHKIFYQVSCNREKLQAVLEEKLDSKVCWTTLEDLALKNEKSNKAYQVVLMDRGEKEVKEREAFLGLAK